VDAVVNRKVDDLFLNLVTTSKLADIKKILQGLSNRVSDFAKKANLELNDKDDAGNVTTDKFPKLGEEHAERY